VIRNPILPGSHPDPSIVRVGDDFYVATSTFEWCPGVLVHHSRDLVHWRPLGGILTDDRLLELAGVPDSGGIWAPCLTHANGRFHLVFTVVDSYARGYKDLQNYLVTAADITGPWSDAVPLHGRGFDASLFHDTDGSAWLLNMVFDSRPGGGFAGIEAQCVEDGELVGTPQTIFTGTAIGVTEGPHLYRRNGWYYLMVAEGGTGYDHQVTMARSRVLTGPYETDPDGPMLTARHDADLELQKAGHGCLVETQTGQWYLAHLVARPYSRRGACVLGRETAIQQVRWVDEWPRVPGGVPTLTTPAPDLPEHPWPSTTSRDDFDGPALGPQWSTLRRPASRDWLGFTDRPGYLRIRGGQSPYGRRTPSLVARRVTATRCTFETTMEFAPEDIHQSAGITAYYNAANWHALQLTTDGERAVLELVTSDRGVRTVHARIDAAAHAECPVQLRVAFDGPRVRFAYAWDGSWSTVPVDLDATILSDEHADDIVDGQVRTLGFTGAFVGLWVQDLAAHSRWADFDHATYVDEPASGAAATSAPEVVR